MYLCIRTFSQSLVKSLCPSLKSQFFSFYNLTVVRKTDFSSAFHKPYLFILFFVWQSSCRGNRRIRIFFLPEVPELWSVVRKIMHSFHSLEYLRKPLRFPQTGSPCSLSPWKILCLREVILLPRDFGNQKAKLSWGQRLADRIFQKLAGHRALTWNVSDGTSASVL